MGLEGKRKLQKGQVQLSWPSSIVSMNTSGKLSRICKYYRCRQYWGLNSADQDPRFRAESGFLSRGLPQTGWGAQLLQEAGRMSRPFKQGIHDRVIRNKNHGLGAVPSVIVELIPQAKHSTHPPSPVLGLSSWGCLISLGPPQCQPDIAIPCQDTGKVPSISDHHYCSPLSQV